MKIIIPKEKEPSFSVVPDVIEIDNESVLAQLAEDLFKRQLDRRVVFAVLKEVNQRRCSEPVAADDLQKILTEFTPDNQDQAETSADHKSHTESESALAERCFFFLDLGLVEDEILAGLIAENASFNYQLGRESILQLIKQQTEDFLRDAELFIRSPKSTLRRSRSKFGEAILKAVEDPAGTIRSLLKDSAFLKSAATVALLDNFQYEESLQQLKGFGAIPAHLEILRDAVKEETAQFRRAMAAVKRTGTALVPLSRDLSEISLEANLVAPPGYRIDQDGVFSEDEKKKGKSRLIFAGGLIISARSVDIDTGQETVRLSWRREGEWRSKWVSRSVIAKPSRLVNLADLGLSVTSATASDLVAFLNFFEAANIEVIPRIFVSSHLGYQGEHGEYGFLTGDAYVGPDGSLTTEFPKQLDDFSDWTDERVFFRSTSPGEQQVAEGFHQAGSFENWKEAIGRILPYPRVMLAVLASLTTPILSILGVPNFGLDISGSTSRGKTKTLRLAASVWGKPNERDSRSAMMNWDLTKVNNERVAALISGLPLIIDETKLAQSSKFVAYMIYSVIGGKGRGRGTSTGLQATVNWNTIMITSGEQPITSFVKEHGGQHARVISIVNPPFEDLNDAAFVDEVDAIVQSNYGHAGPQLVSYLLRKANTWDSLAYSFAEAKDKYLKRAEGNPVAARFAAYLAALETTASILPDALGIILPEISPVEMLYEEIVQETAASDKATEALRAVYNWAQQNRSRFYSKGDRRAAKSNVKYWGRWDAGNNWRFLGIYPAELEKCILAGGFNPEEILRAWKESETIDTSTQSSNRFTKQVRIGGPGAHYLVCIRRETIEAILEDDRDE